MNIELEKNMFDPYLGQHLFEEHERRVCALQWERVALKARAERTNAMAQLAGKCVRLAVGLAMTTWRWGRSTLHRTPPPPRHPVRLDAK
ncbi:MAG: hypothetical protein DCC55_31230 [Chloroflexi bacterium]|nr:MAG: hypothetical protein DCC55_31230 [Chloroflexota bacterium]